MDVGFNPQNLLLFRVNPQLNRYDEKRTAALYREMIERLAAVPGVRGRGVVAAGAALGQRQHHQHLHAGPDLRAGRRDRDNSINRLVVSPNFFDVMEIPLLAGRGLHRARQRRRRRRSW